MRSIEQRPRVALQGVHLRKIVTEPLSYTAPSTNPPPLHSLPYLTKKKTLFYTAIQGLSERMAKVKRFLWALNFTKS